MGQKVNPNSFRIGIIKGWQSNWVTGKKKFAQNLKEDHLIRTYFAQKVPRELLGNVLIQRTLKITTVILQTSRPPLLIGQNGKNIDQHTQALKKICQQDVQINVKQIRKSDLNAKLVAENVAAKIANRASYKRTVRQAISNAMRMGAEGIKIQTSGRLNGAEIARSESDKEGRLPLQTLRADIDYAEAQALTTYGIIGIKVWIFLGEVYGVRDLSLHIDSPVAGSTRNKNYKK